MPYLRSVQHIAGLLAALSSISLVQTAAILPEPQLASDDVGSVLEKRCANPCGFYNQVCCEANEVCGTNGSGEAQCQAENGGGEDGGWQEYTTAYGPPLNKPTPPPGHGDCSSSLDEIPCGDKCCSSGQYCKTDVNECAAFDSESSELLNTFTFTSAAPTASVPVRPTSNSVFTVVATGAPTTTVPFEAPVGTDGSTLIGLEATSNEGGLSPGAIAGIVIGVIIGIIILLLICLCCCAKGVIDAIMGFFQGRRRTQRTETYVEERRHHHSGRQGSGRNWYGSRPTRVDREKSSGSRWGSIARVGTGLGALGAGLGLKRKYDQRRAAKTHSSYTGSDDYYTDTSPSSLSSDQLSRNDRRTSRR